VSVPVALAIFGADYVITRNLIMAMVPLVVLAGIASTRTRAGPALVAGICAAGLIAYIGVENNGAYQRDDWRGVAAAIGPLGGATTTAVVLAPAGGETPLAVYAPLKRLDPVAVISPRAVDVVAQGRNPPAPPAAAPLAGFTATIQRTADFTIVRYVAAAPVALSYAQLAQLTFVPGAPAVLVGPPYPAG
jgi:hypothetical protein